MAEECKADSSALYNRGDMVVIDYKTHPSKDVGIVVKAKFGNFLGSVRRPIWLYWVLWRTGNCHAYFGRDLKKIST